MFTINRDQIFCKIIFVILLITFQAPAFSQHSGAGYTGYPFDIPNKIPVQPSQKPRSHFVIEGLSNELQTWVDHAVDNMHGFWIYEAERILRYVISKENFSPMLHALAAWNHKIFNSGDFERGKQYLDRAKFLAKQSKLRHRENLYIQAVSALYENQDKDLKPVPIRHLEILETIVNEYPEDHEAAFFWCLGAWLNLEYEEENKNINQEKAKQFRYEIQNFLDNLLYKLPFHPAHHYKIHLWNNATDEFNALESARKISPANFEIAHLWHMPAHIFNRTQDFGYAIRHTEIAHRVDNQYLVENQIQATQIHNYVHNYRDFSLRLHAQAGRPKYALERALAILKSPRLIHQKSRFAHLKLAKEILLILEKYRMWEFFLELERNNVFVFLESGLEDADLEFSSELDRMKVLACVEAQDQEKKFSCDISDFLNRLSNRASKNAKYEKLGRLAEDARIRYEIKQYENSKLFAPSAYFKKLKSLDVTSSNTLMLLSYNHRDLYTSKDLFHNLFSRNPWDSNPVELADLLAVLMLNPEFATGVTPEGFQKILDEKAEQIGRFLVEGFESDFLANSFLGLYFHDFLQEKILLKSWERLKQESQVVPESYKYLNEKSLESFGSLDSDLGKLNLDDVSDELRSKILPNKGKYKLLTFLVGPGCPSCDEQSRRIIASRDFLLEMGVEPLFITQSDPKELSDFAVADQDLVLHQKLGAYDEIDALPLHGVTFIDSEGRLLFKSVSQHPILDVDELIKEFARLVLQRG